MEFRHARRPEVFDMSPRSRSATSFGWRARLERGKRLITWMMSASIPALLLDSACVWLYNQAHVEGVALAWPLLLIFIVPALLASLITALIEIFMLGALIATCIGKDVVISPRTPFTRGSSRPIKTVN